MVDLANKHQKTSRIETADLYSGDMKKSNTVVLSKFEKSNDPRLSFQYKKEERTSFSGNPLDMDDFLLND